mmetsp:Transcript_9818/g.9663  ORF Transcript_9818/g.9663 Transcript_9818/m.9663 type:complete len:206 (-) Transcript_9818:540-1157(-)
MDNYLLLLGHIILNWLSDGSLMNFSGSSDLFFGFSLGLFNIHFSDNSDLLDSFINFNDRLLDGDFLSGCRDNMLLFINNRDNNVDFSNDFDFISLDNFLVGCCSINLLNDINGLFSNNIHGSGGLLHSLLNVYGLNDLSVDSLGDRLCNIDLHSLHSFNDLVISFNCRHGNVNNSGRGNRFFNCGNSGWLNLNFWFNHFDSFNDD